MAAGTLGEFEVVILLAVLRTESHAYGSAIRREIAQRSGQPPARGSVYVTLDRLERKGYLRSHRRRCHAGARRTAAAVLPRQRARAGHASQVAGRRHPDARRPRLDPGSGIDGPQMAQMHRYEGLLPRLLTMLLERLVPSERRAETLGDLCEDYGLIARQRGRWAARAWLFGEAASLARAWCGARVRRVPGAGRFCVATRGWLGAR